jgi:hypothetical protein
MDASNADFKVPSHNANALLNNPNPISQIDEILNLSDEFKKITSNLSKSNYDVKICPIDERGCSANGIDRARMTFRPGSIYGATIEIFFKKTLPLIERIKYVLIEFCNANHAKEFHDLDRNAAYYSKDKYTRLKEGIEFKAINEAIKISKTIDAHKLFPTAIFSKSEEDDYKNFEDYYSECLSNGHADSYNNDWLTNSI